jgi:D-threo-aldose 1-dehydrogenase
LGRLYDRSNVGQTEVSVSGLAFGASGLGDMPLTYGYSVDEDRALQTLFKIFDSGINLLDTSRNYGFGRSEERIGRAICEYGGLPEGFVVSTKLDRSLENDVLDGDQAWRSFEQSQKALGIEKIPMLHLHDPEHVPNIEDVTKTGGALDQLFKMKEQGLAMSVGLAMGDTSLMLSLLKLWPFDAIITHNRYTLINRNAESVLAYAHDHGMTVINAAPFASGILATGSGNPGKSCYSDVTEETLDTVRQLEAICHDFDVDLKSAAIQFSTRDHRVTSTLLGVTRPERIAETIALASRKIPDEFWNAISAIVYSTNDPEADRDYKLG